MKIRRDPMRVAITAAAGVAAVGTIAFSAGGATAAAAMPSEGRHLHADFNGDGFADLAVGVPFEDQAATNDGAVNVIYGGPGGLSAAGNEVWSQGNQGITGNPEAGDQFGYSLAAADFNGDGFTDLAVGVPFEDQVATNDGAVNVIYGGPGGLSAAGNEVWSQGNQGITGNPEAGDLFGYSLAAGNFGNSSQADLAVGVPFEDQVATNDGAVNVIYGAATGGLGVSGNQVWSQGNQGITGNPEAGDQFGYSLAAGNFGNSSQADLAVGVPFEDQVATNDGAVNVIYGGPGGLSAAGNEVWSQGNQGITGNPEAGDLFGYSLAAGNFGNSSQADLAVGVPFEDQVATNDGAVNVIYGAATGGLGVSGNQVWSQGNQGITGNPEAGDQFGYSLAAGNFGNSSQADLAVGVPFEDQVATNDGAVNVIYGGPGGLSAAGNEVWSQGNQGITGNPEAGDLFGYSLAAGNFGNSSQADLAVGVPFEDQVATNDGAVNVIYGAATGGLGVSGNQVWSQGNQGITGNPEAGDQFGTALATRRP